MKRDKNGTQTCYEILLMYISCLCPNLVSIHFYDASLFLYFLALPFQSCIHICYHSHNVTLIYLTCLCPILVCSFYATPIFHLKTLHVSPCVGRSIVPPHTLYCIGIASLVPQAKRWIASFPGRNSLATVGACALFSVISQ